MARSHTAPAWRRAFLRELARSGSVALAAEKCGIDRSSAYQVRKANPAFAASWERALSFARLRMSASAEIGAVPRPRPLPRRGGGTRADSAREGKRAPRLRGDEVVRASKAGRPCIVRAGPGRWCVDSEQAFLAELAASANVKAAARAAGVSAVAAYNRRRQWPAFAAAWDAARAEGWLRIELLLIHAAGATLDPEPPLRPFDPSTGSGLRARDERPEMTVEQAMQLWFHRPGARDGAGGGRGRGHGWRRREPDIEQVRAEILRKVAAMEKARRLRGESRAAVAHRR